MNMVEKVALAIWEATDLEMTMAEMAARAAIEAMREPTEEMKHAGRNGVCGIIHDVGGAPEDHFSRLWRLGINAALEE